MSELEQGTQPILRRYEIPENEAHGCVSALYEDIRRILDLGMVNLIYRRMAGADGVLEWVWGTIRDTAGSCKMARHLSLLGKDVCWQRLSSLEAAGLPLLGIDNSALEKVSRVLAEYNRGNSLNLLLLRAFVETQRQEGWERSTKSLPQQSRRSSRSNLVPILDLDQMDDRTEGLVRLLASYFCPPESPMIPSLFRHLAHWPGFLALVSPTILSAIGSGKVQKISNELKKQAFDGAPRLAVGMYTPDIGHAPSEEMREYWLGEIESFLAKPIPEMIVIGRMVESILPLYGAKPASS